VNEAAAATDPDGPRPQNPNNQKKIPKVNPARQSMKHSALTPGD